MKSIDEMAMALANQYVLPLSNYNAGLSIEVLKAKYNVSRVSKLGSNENPFGTPESVKQLLKQDQNLAHYPDPTCSEFKKVLSKKLAVDEKSLIIGNGSEDIIAMISHAFIEVKDKVLTVVPSFGLHILYPKSRGAEIIISHMTKNLEFDVPGLCQSLKNEVPKVFFIASPSNPVGCTLTTNQIKQLLDSQQPETIFVFDEAYYEYAVDNDQYPDALNLLQDSKKPFILLRTLSKAYSLAGIRIGYGVCASQKMAMLLDKIRLPFNANKLAQKAAIVALADQAHLKKTISWNNDAKERVFKKLQTLGLQPVPSKGNFLFFKTEFQSIDIAEKLLKQGVIIKPWLEDGYKHFLRVSIGNDEDNEHFITSLEKVLLAETSRA